MNWIPLHQHSKFSQLDAISSAANIAKKCIELGYTSAALTDHGTISGSVQFSAAMKKVGLKSILGCELYLSPYDSTVKEQNNRKCSHLCILAKNLNGWKSLIQIVSNTNRPENFYYRPRINLESIANFNSDKNLIAFSGHPGSDLWNCMFSNGQLLPDAKERASHFAQKYISIFGKENFFMEIQGITLSDSTALNILREVATSLNIKPIATADSHYISRIDARDQRVLLCSSLKTTLNKVYTAIDNDEFGLTGFFTSDCFHIPTIEELSKYNTEEEINNCLIIDEMCENYSILNQPKVPKFDESKDSKLLLRQIVNSNLKKLSGNKATSPEYSNRLEQEFKVIEEANLCDYFLVVQDYINWAKGKNILVGPGRGSSGGSLIAYLTNITEIDPIENGLYFERFYNAGRNTKDNISLPDIDTDFPSNFRNDVINYIKDKYGKDRVAQIATFGELQGRSALKEVFRVHEFDYKMADKICSKIPEFSKISDKLEESGEESILKWTLLYEPEALVDYAKIDDNGNIFGPYSEYVEQAIRLEGCYKSRGKHAAGIIIAPEPIETLAPIIYENEEAIVGLDKNDCEKIGLLKMDILATSVLDKLMAVNDLLMFGEIKNA